MIAEPHCIEMRPVSQEWLDSRCSYLGGTDIAAIMELHPYKTAHLVYLEKKGLKNGPDLNEPMVHGSNLELYVAQVYSRLTGRKLHKSRLYRSKDRPHLAANPDYEVRGERPLRLVECKTAGYFAGQIFGTEGDAVPDQYLVQCMWQLAITGRQVCDLAVLIGGQDFRTYSIERDEDLIKTLVTVADNWWKEYMLTDTPPPLSGEKPDSEYINSQYPQSADRLIFAPPEVDSICIDLRAARQTVTEAEAEKSRLENLIKQAMGDAGALECSIGSITWKTNGNGQRRFLTKFKEVSTL